MSPAQVRSRLGLPESVGSRDVLGKPRSDVVWWYWRGAWLYGVVFVSDTNNQPATVCDRYRWSRLVEWPLMPPRKPAPMKREGANQTRQPTPAERLGSNSDGAGAGAVIQNVS
jgi:hypothetical protein